MPFKLVQQIIIIGVGVAVVFLYIQPQLQTIQQKQTEVAQYSDAVAQATEFNRELNSKLNQINSISSLDLERVERFLPQSVDAVAVARDLQSLGRRNGLIVNTITTADDESTGEVNRIQDISDEFDPMLDEEAVFDRDFSDRLTTVHFKVQVVGTYDDFVAFLTATEANAYPLEVVTLNIVAAGDDESATQTASNLLTYDVTFAVHAVGAAIE